jgi:HAD superfamily hydrolase (TIGR01509 family)
MIAVIFDMDGVLVDSEPVITEAAILGLREYGVQAVPEDFIPFVGTGEDRFIGGVAEKYGAVYEIEMKKRVYQIYLNIVQEKIKVFEGVHTLLNLLQEKGIPFAVGSSADRIKVDANLKAADIPIGWFSAVVSGENVQNKKPAPDVFLQAAQAMGVQPVDCIVVEDAVNGIRAAKAGGMKCIAVTTSFSEEELLKENPDSICRDIPAVQQELMCFAQAL